MIGEGILWTFYEWYLRSQCQYIPNHIAIIQDGNRRYAKNVGMSISDGHRFGADTTEKMLDWARDLGITHITLYCFSTENFTRDKKEITDLLELFKEKLKKVADDNRIHTNKIRVQVLGDRSLLPSDLKVCIEEAEDATKSYTSYFINLALAYGGRNEIVHAARELISMVRDGDLCADDIDPNTIESHLNGGKQIPPVDLIIRTGNERRTSNFLPWHANGNECAVYFCAPNWPSFRRIDLLRAIRVYDQRMQLKMINRNIMPRV